MPPLGFLEDAVLQVQLAHGGMNGQERIHHETCYDFILFLFLIIAYFLLTFALISFYEFAAIVKAMQK